MSRSRFHCSLILLTVLFPAIGQSQDIPTYSAEDQGTYFREWLAIGPFVNTRPMDWAEYDYDRDAIGFFSDLLAASGGEAAIDPEPGEQVADPNSDRTLVWKAISSQEDTVSFEKLIGPNDYSVAYAFCVIEAQKEHRAILSVGSNDGIKIFLNGELAHEHHIPRWLGTDTDYVPVTLREGRNRLLVKVDESSGDWGFSARLLDYESTLATLEEKLPELSRFTVVTRDEVLVAEFGEPYQIETLNPGARVTVRASDSSGHEIAMLKGRPGERIEFPLSCFTAGPLNFTASFPLGNGKFVHAERGHYVGRLPRHELPETIGRDLAFSHEGRRFFPIGTYGAAPEDYADLVKAGYNFAVVSPNRLDKAHEAGLLAAVPFHGDDEHYLEELAETVRKHKDHPAILCWMLADEPGHNRMDLLNMHRAYELVEEIDGVHPSYLVITNNNVYETFGRCCDVLAIDTYPISKKAPITDVGDNIALAYRTSDGDLPIWHCGQIFNWPSDRYPTPAEHRFMTYQALQEGAKGLLWFTYRWEGKTVEEHSAELWAEHLRILSEVKELEPLLLAEGLGNKLPTDHPQLRVSLKHAGEAGNLLIALNTSTQESFQGSVNLPEGAPAEWKEIGASETLQPQRGTLDLNLPPLGVKVLVSVKP
jgi:hypothetical protein